MTNEVIESHTGLYQLEEDICKHTAKMMLQHYFNSVSACLFLQLIKTCVRRKHLIYYVFFLNVPMIFLEISLLSIGKRYPLFITIFVISILHFHKYIFLVRVVLTFFVHFSGETSFVVKHILELRLFVMVAWVGPSLEWLVNTLTTKYLTSNQSLVVLSREPSTVTLWGNDKYTSVTFPPCSLLNAVGCKYELQRLIKLAWSRLEQGAKPAYQVS